MNRTSLRFIVPKVVPNRTLFRRKESILPYLVRVVHIRCARGEYHMNFTQALLRSLVVSGLVVGIGAAQAPDNTKVNKRDTDKSQPTADQAKNAISDRDIMQKIRKAVVGDKSLSSYGHNVKIISQHGKVTLKGPVHTEEEKKNIEAKAVEVAGAGNVTNMLEVKGDKAAR
jgi:hyperosmotically inducible protein